MKRMDEFLEDQNKIETKRAYRQHINSYFSILKVEPEKYFEQGRDYDQDFLDFAKAIINYSSRTRAARLNAVKLFLEYDDDIIISKKILKRTVKKIRVRTLTLDTIPTNAQLKQILQHGTLKDRALFLMAASSGMRISEVLQLEEEDIDFNHNPVMIRIRGEISKNGLPRITFISNESKEVLLEWLKVRDDYLKQAISKTIKSPLAHPKNPDDKTVFCFSYHTAQRMWNRLLTKSGYDKKDRSTNRMIIHIHSLRKWFETRMSTTGIPEAIYQQLEGHEGYLNGAYKRYTQHELAENYLEAMPKLSVFEATPDLSGVHEQLTEVTQDNKELRQQLNDLRMKLLEVELKQVQELQRRDKK